MPFLLFSVYMGALADRYDCRKLIQVSQGMFMLASLAWGLLFLTDTLQLWHAVVILLVHGAAGVSAATATQLILHDMVGSADLPSAIRTNASSRNLAILLGPAVGGGMMLLLGPAWGLLANVGLYWPFTLFLLRVPYTGHGRRGQAPPRAAGFGFADSLRLLRQVSAERRIVMMITLAAATSFFVGNAFQAQMPEYAHDFGADKAGGWYSVLLAGNAAGALLGAIFLETLDILRPSARAAIVSAGLWGIVSGIGADRLAEAIPPACRRVVEAIAPSAVRVSADEAVVVTPDWPATGATHFVPSFSVLTTEPCSIRFELSARVGGEWSPWVASVGLGPAPFDSGSAPGRDSSRRGPLSVDVDVYRATAPVKAVRLRVRVRASDPPRCSRRPGPSRCRRPTRAHLVNRRPRPPRPSV